MTILKSIKLLGLIALLSASPFLVPQTVAQPGVTVSLDVFYNELAPYGQWMQYPGYGNVWAPNVGPDFQPYGSAGHWVVTEFGNTWVSDYPWGWAPFHYGRWIFDNAYGGWLWVPGTDWGPAWVAWRSGGGYYGWAPLGPGMNISVNINIPAPFWTFVPQIYITSPRVYSYYVPRPNVVNVYYNTTYINNYYRTNNRAYVYGPPRGDIERVTRHSVPVYRIDHMDRPGRSVVGNGSVSFYRPDHGPANRPDYSRNDRYNNNDRYTNDRYNNNDRFNNNNGNNNGRPDNWNNNTPGRGSYNDGNSSSRGSYNPNPSNPGRGGYMGDPNGNYNPNGSNSPSSSGRGSYYDGNSSNRGSMNDRFPSNRGGAFGNPSSPTPNANPFPAQPDHSGSGRGSYQMPQPGNSMPQTMPQQPNRSFEQPSHQMPSGSQPFPNARGGNSFPQHSENRGSQVQPRTESGQNNSRFGHEGGRGPR